MNSFYVVFVLHISILKCTLVRLPEQATKVKGRRELRNDLRMPDVLCSRCYIAIQPVSISQICITLENTEYWRVGGQTLQRSQR